jgi:hypothetical protein
VLSQGRKILRPAIRFIHKSVVIGLGYPHPFPNLRDY